MASAVNQVEEEKPETADIALIGPPLGGQESDLENENDDSLCVDGLPNEVSREQVFNVHNRDLLTMMTSMMTMFRLLLHLHQRKQKKRKEKENHIKW